MKTIRWVLALLGLGLLASGPAWADRFHHHHGGHAHLGIIIGGPVWDPWPWYYRPYYPPPVVVVPAPAPPPVYIEQGNSAAPVEPAYWYYCSSARAYYPYVKDCPGGWQKVVPQAPPQ